MDGYLTAILFTGALCAAFGVLMGLLAARNAMKPAKRSTLRRRAIEAGDLAAIASLDADREAGRIPDIDNAVQCAMEAAVDVMEARR
jgi:hypothetical protein